MEKKYCTVNVLNSKKLEINNFNNENNITYSK